MELNPRLKQETARMGHTSSMHSDAKNLLWLAFFSAILLTISCSTGVGIRIREQDYPFLSNTNSAMPIVWRKQAGPDFLVFNGQTKTNKDCGFGIYRGGHPSFEQAEGVVHIQGQLGAFNPDWRQTSDNTGFNREAIFDYHTEVYRFQKGPKEYRFTEKIHVWIYGPTKEEVEALTGYLGGLELFREKPKDTIKME